MSDWLATAIGILIGSAIGGSITFLVVRRIIQRGINW